MPTRQITALIVPSDGGDPLPTIEAVDSALRDYPGDHTILVVSPEKAPAHENPHDSEESTTKTLRLIWEQHPALHPLRLIAGWRLALQQKSDLIFTTDDSWCPDPKEITKFLNLYESGARIVAGRRPETTYLENIQRKWTKFTSRSNLSDPSSPVRLYDRKALQIILDQDNLNNPKYLTTSKSSSRICSDKTALLTHTIATLERKSGFATKETPATLLT